VCVLELTRLRRRRYVSF